MRFLCIGAGAIGTYIGGSLLSAGETVTFVERAEAIDRIKDQGMTVVRTDGTAYKADGVSIVPTASDALALLDRKIDILVNSAGMQRRHPSEEFPMSDWDQVLEVNLTAPFHLCQMAGREMLKAGYGKIINLSSMNGFFGGSTIPAYAASKGGINQMTKTLCNDWAGSGITVNAIAPGYMETEMNAALMDPENPRNAEITKRIPVHRWGRPDDLKGVCVFLASEASAYVNGAIIPVDGGYLAKS